MTNLHGIWIIDSTGNFFTLEISIRVLDFIIESYFWLCTYSLYRSLKTNQLCEGSRLYLLEKKPKYSQPSVPVPMIIVESPSEGDNGSPSIRIPRVKVESSYNPNYLRISTGMPEELRIVEVPRVRVRCNSSRF